MVKAQRLKNKNFKEGVLTGMLIAKRIQHEKKNGKLKGKGWFRKFLWNIAPTFITDKITQKKKKKEEEEKKKKAAAAAAAEEQKKKQQKNSYEDVNEDKDDYDDDEEMEFEEDDFE